MFQAVARSGFNSDTLYISNLPTMYERKSWKSFSLSAIYLRKRVLVRVRLIEGKTPTFIHVVFKFPPTSWTLETWSHGQNSSTATLVRCGVLQTERTDLSKTFHDGKYSIAFLIIVKTSPISISWNRKFSTASLANVQKNQSFGRNEQVNNFWGPKCLQNFEKQAYSVGSSYSSVLRVLIRGVQAWSYEFYKPLC